MNIQLQRAAKILDCNLKTTLIVCPSRSKWTNRIKISAGSRNKVSDPACTTSSGKLFQALTISTKKEYL